jgi:acetyl esterase/lipase
VAPDAPLIVFFHGGNWRMGSADQHVFVGRALARLGAVAVLPDYRLWPEVAFPEFVADSALAFAWAARNAPGRRAYAMGHSAGAFNAAAIALDPAWGVRGLAAGFVGLAGPYEFDAEEASPPAIFGGLRRVHALPPGVSLAGAPPLLLLHGDADTIVRPAQSALLAARARASGVPVTHRVYPGVGHIGVIAALAAPVRALGLAGGDVLGDVGRFVAVA